MRERGSEGAWEGGRERGREGNTNKMSPEKHVELLKDHLQNNYTPITKNLDYEEHYNLVHIPTLCI